MNMRTATTEIPLKPLATGHMMGVRNKAVPVRQRVENALIAGQEVVIDFTGVEVTQSFVDELIGVLVLHLGPEALERVTFRGCSDTVKAILQFVAADRVDQVTKQH